MKRTFPTRVALSENHRAELVATLNAALATSIDLQMQVKQAHWNIKGPQFFARHELFDKLAGRLRGWTDEIAERVSTLGGYAEGTARLAAKGTLIDEYDLDAVDGRAHMRALIERYAVYTAALRQSIEASVENGDPVTEDLFTEVARGAEMDMWFLESHVNV